MLFWKNYTYFRVISNIVVMIITSVTRKQTGTTQQRTGILDPESEKRDYESDRHITPNKIWRNVELLKNKKHLIRLSLEKKTCKNYTDIILIARLMTCNEVLGWTSTLTL